MQRYLILPVCTCSLIISLLARGQDRTPANAFAGLTYNLTISPTETWVDTRIDLHPGDALQINAVTSTGGCSPNGAKTSQNDTLPLNTALPGALIGKLSEGGTLFFVGSRKELKGANVPLDTELGKKVDGLPRRVNDQFNNLGDMVNFVIVGSEQQVQSAF